MQESLLVLAEQITLTRIIAQDMDPELCKICLILVPHNTRLILIYIVAVISPF